MDKSSLPTEPVYRIQTKRLVIRCWEPKDAPLLMEAVEQSREHLLPWMPWAARIGSDALQEYVERIRRWRGQFDLSRDFVYAVFNPEESRVLGGSGLHTRLGEGAREIGYWIHKDFAGQGLATELSAALVRVAFEILEMKRIEIHCDPQNVRSAAVPRKLGFKMEAVLKKRMQTSDAEWRDSMIWTLFAEEHPSRPARKTEMAAFDVMGRRFVLPE
jgi:RimJ/RimL family protein N-acetyltransferase